jgi:hypothetical protein
MSLTKRALTVFIFFALFLSQVHAIDNGEGVLRAMYERYKTTWYSTVTFTQKSTTYNADGTTKVETWYEAALLPGKLRIDIAPLSDGNGYVFADGNVTIVKEGKVTGSRPHVNMLLVLGFDVYRQSPETTVSVAKSQGYDLSKFHEETWESRPVYVIGADKDDLQSRQFWVEKDTLLFVRDIEPARADPKKWDDIRFTNYRKLADAWIAARVEVHSDDKLVFSEDYSDIQADVKLDPAVFDPTQFNSTHWEKQ